MDIEGMSFEDLVNEVNKRIEDPKVLKILKKIKKKYEEEHRKGKKRIK